ncbi:protogenin A [Trichonephila clavipes]|nr:protogenin A [Trichonephila clavipes]
MYVGKCRHQNNMIRNLPRFDEQPQDLTVYPGKTAYFPCSIQGHPPADITWYKDDRLLRVEKDRMTVLPSGALEIQQVKTSDSGTYKCNASNIERHRISSSGTLTVSLDYAELSKLSLFIAAEMSKLSAPQFIAVPRSNFVVESHSITLDCAANGNPTPKITWLKDGATIDLQDVATAMSMIRGPQATEPPENTLRDFDVGPTQD